MRMSPTDILDVTGATYTYLINGQPPASNWTALFRPDERVRLRFINGSSMSIFDVRIDGLPTTVVQADGNDVEPVTVDEFRISVAETYDVIVQPKADRAYTLFVQAEDRSGYARGTLAPRPGMVTPIPPMDPRPMRTMAIWVWTAWITVRCRDGHGVDGEQADGPRLDAARIDAGNGPQCNARHEIGSRQDGPGRDAGNGHGAQVDVRHGQPGCQGEKYQAQRRGRQCRRDAGRAPQGSGRRLSPGRRVLTYADLRATRPGDDPRPPSHEITLHLTGNMERFIWGFDGKKFSEAGVGHGPGSRVA
jgi:FtsP/CotA-like multicopper oxidase with cupredoxin domain